MLTVQRVIPQVLVLIKNTLTIIKLITIYETKPTRTHAYRRATASKNLYALLLLTKRFLFVRLPCRHSIESLVSVRCDEPVVPGGGVAEGAGAGAVRGAKLGQKERGDE